MENIKFVIEKSARIDKLIDDLYGHGIPEIEVSRALLITESYKQTEHLPIVNMRSAAFKHILENIPVVIRDNELIVGSATVSPRACQVFPEFSFEWLESEFDTIDVPDSVEYIGYGLLSGIDSIKNLSIPFIGLTKVPSVLTDLQKRLTSHLTSQPLA